jgi:hypothetical protein
MSITHNLLLALPLRSAILGAQIGALARQAVGALYATPSEAGIREDRACLSQVPPLTPAPSCALESARRET